MEDSKEEYDARRITLDRADLFWTPRNPRVIHLVSNDHRFTAQDGVRPGLWVTFSEVPASANYHPQNFNRGVRALVEHGFGYPLPYLVPEYDRRLDLRGLLLDGYQPSNI